MEIALLVITVRDWGRSVFMVSRSCEEFGGQSRPASACSHALTLLFWRAGNIAYEKLLDYSKSVEERARASFLSSSNPSPD